MKKLAAAVAAVALGALVVTAVAGAGEPSNTEGDHVILQVSVSPPRVSTAKRPQPVGVVFDSREYTDNGQRSTHPTRTNAFRFNGFRFHPNPFAKCRESKLEKQGPSGCPAGSRLGKGYAIVDARPTLADPLKASAQAFNGLLDVDPSGKPITPVPAVLIYAKTSNGLTAYVPALFKGSDALITEDRGQSAQSPYTLTTVHLSIARKTTKLGGKTAGFIEAPRACRGGLWNFSETDTFVTAAGNPPSNVRISRDTQPCVKG